MTYPAAFEQWQLEDYLKYSMELLEEVQEEEDLQAAPHNKETDEGGGPSELEMILDRVQDNLATAFSKFATKFPDEAVEIDNVLHTMKTVQWFKLPSLEVMGHLDDLHDAIMTLLASVKVKRRLRSGSN